MTLDEFRRDMNEFWASVDQDAQERKDSYAALERLQALYRKLDPNERLLADRVLAEWVLSTEEAKRFDAVALIRQFRIVSAVPALRRLAGELLGGTDPGARFEREKVEGLIRELEASEGSLQE